MATDSRLDEVLDNVAALLAQKAGDKGLELLFDTAREVPPVLVGDAIVAAVDLKTDRQNRKVLVQKWTWIGKGQRRVLKPAIEQALHRFERFQLSQ